VRKEIIAHFDNHNFEENMFQTAQVTWLGDEFRGIWYSYYLHVIVRMKFTI
jgi:hypothetical protein